MKDRYGDVAVTRLDGFVVQLEIQRAPNNFFDVELIQSLDAAMIDIDNDPDARAIVLCSEGKHFCAGANFGDPNQNAARADRDEAGTNPLYTAAVELFKRETPIVAAVQGAAVGGGFGLAVMADFRVLCPNTRMTANFVKLGFTPGFGLTRTLEAVIGRQRSALLFYTGRRINGETAMEWGLGDVYTDNDNVRNAAIELAAEIAENAPLAVVSVRKQLRGDIAGMVKAATDIENQEQFRLQKTEDHKEGVKAVGERRPGNFKGR